MGTLSRGQQAVVLILIFGMTLLYYHSIYLPENQSQEMLFPLGRTQSQRPRDMAAKTLTGAQLLTLNKKININTATKTDLEAIIGIGPRTAEKIVEYRKSHGIFKRVEDIKNVKGITEKRFDKIKFYITVE